MRLYYYVYFNSRVALLLCVSFSFCEIVLSCVCFLSETLLLCIYFKFSETLLLVSGLF